MVREGQFRSTAARVLGIAPETLCRWMARPESRYRQFRQALLAAEAGVEVDLVESVTKGATEDPQLALRLLERRFPQRWGRKHLVAEIGPAKTHGESAEGDAEPALARHRRLASWIPSLLE